MLKPYINLPRFLRRLFEHKNLKKVLGVNLAFMVVASSFMPGEALNVEAEETIIREGAVPIVTQKTVQYPVKIIKITQGYTLFHPGLDFDGITGDVIYPVKDGWVEAISNSKYAYGNAILINHGENITSLYAHLSEIDVFEGEKVSTLTKIGEMGATGRAFGDHLHFEVRKNGVPISPYFILPRN